MIQVKRLGHATFTTPDLEEQIAYWTEVIGLALITRDANSAILGTRLGQESVALVRAPEKGELRSLAFQVKPGTDLGACPSLAERRHRERTPFGYFTRRERCDCLS